MAEEDRRNVIGEISTGSVHRGGGRNEMNRETKERWADDLHVVYT